MKKLIYFSVFIFHVFFIQNTFAASTKPYYDEYGNKIGYAAIEYIGTSNNFDIVDLRNKVCEEFNGVICLKLTEDLFFLVGEALNEYYVEKGEVYYIVAFTVNQFNRVTEMFYIFAEITEANKNDFYYNCVACKSYEWQHQELYKIDF